jgi:tetratricopeptide (TPR) repeat protein
MMKNAAAILSDVGPTEDELEAFYAIGRICYERDDFKRAADIFRFITTADPTNQKAWWGLGSCHAALEDYAVAGGLYEIGFLLSGQGFDLGYLSAHAWVQAGEYDEAERVLDALHELTLEAGEQDRLQRLCSQMPGVRR